MNILFKRVYISSSGYSYKNPKAVVTKIKNPHRSRAAGYFLILLGIDVAVELRGVMPKQEIKRL